MIGCVILKTPVVPSTTTDDTVHSSTFTVPAYNTLTVEVWAPGSAGTGFNAGSTFAPSRGTDSSVSTLGITAGAPNGQTGVAPTGGNTTNTTGASGGNIYTNNTVPGVAGAGGSAPSGGAGGAGASTPSPATPVFQDATGTNGSIPGGGGGGGAESRSGTPADDYQGERGGASGGYSKSVYTFGVTSGFPSVGDVLSYTVGSKGAAFPAIAGKAGDGANGRVRFTVA